MIGRDRRYGGSRQVSLKAKVGIATAVLVGGGAIGVAAATTSHSPSSAANAGYSQHFGFNRTMTQAQRLQLLLATHNQNTLLTQLANLTTVKSFLQVQAGRQVLAAQRGVLVLATRQFLVIQSANGQLHLWATSGNTQFTNATTTASTAALTANTFATQQAMVRNNMIPAAQAVASVNLVNQMVAPVATTRTVTVNVAGTGVTVTVTVGANNTASLNTFNGGRLVNRTNFQNLLLAIKNAQARNQIARGDLVVVAGTRSHGFLQARSVVFAAATGAGQTMTTTGTSTSTGTTTNGATSGGFSGTHS